MATKVHPKLLTKEASQAPKLPNGYVGYLKDDPPQDGMVEVVIPGAPKNLTIEFPLGPRSMAASDLEAFCRMLYDIRQTGELHPELKFRRESLLCQQAAHHHYKGLSNRLAEKVKDLESKVSFLAKVAGRAVDVARGKDEY